MQAGEAALSLHQLVGGRVPLALHLLLTEQSALVHLTQSELSRAQAEILLASTTAAGFPSIFAGLAGSVHVLAGEVLTPPKGIGVWVTWFQRYIVRCSIIFMQMRDPLSTFNSMSSIMTPSFPHPSPLMCGVIINAPELARLKLWSKSNRELNLGNAIPS